MRWTKRMLAGLLAGAMVWGTACRSDKAAERAGEPTAPTEQGGTTGEGGTSGTPPSPGGTGGTGDVGREDSTSTEDYGGSGLGPDMGGSGTLNPENQGTGGSGDTDYIEEDSRFQEDQELGGDKFPSDDTVPWE